MLEIDYISKTKNSKYLKINFSFVSEHCGKLEPRNIVNEQNPLTPLESGAEKNIQKYNIEI